MMKLNGYTNTREGRMNMDIRLEGPLTPMNLWRFRRWLICMKRISQQLRQSQKLLRLGVRRSNFHYGQ